MHKCTIVDTYGHPDAAVARRRIKNAYNQRGNLHHLPFNRRSEEAS